MEEELKCPVCHHLYRDPVILPCNHSVCIQCAENLSIKSIRASTPAPAVLNLEQQPKIPHLETDKASIASEAVLSDSDSGYSAGSASSNNGSPGSTTERNMLPVVGASVAGIVSHFQSQVNAAGATAPCSVSQQSAVSLPSLPKSVSCLTCPVCHRTLFLDDRGVQSLNKNFMLKAIIDRYNSNEPERSQMPALSTFDPTTTFSQPISVVNKCKNEVEDPRNVTCQLCPESPPQKAAVKCVQCAVLYCASCREKCHPRRGPLAQHKLLDVSDGIVCPQREDDKAAPLRPYPALPSKPLVKNGIKLSSCPQHPTENTSLHCEVCRVSLCVQCSDEGKHKNHEVKAIGALYKTQKAQLSQQMSALSNKARQAKDLVMTLRATQEDIERCSSDVESRTLAQCNYLIETVERKRDELLQKVAREKELKNKAVREQLQQCTLKLKQTTGLLEYCIEVMKDDDAAAFLQISQSLTERVSCTERQWTSRHLQPRVKAEYELELRTSQLAVAIDKLDFYQCKAPDKPLMRVEENCCNNNTVILSWAMPSKRPVERYILEMDDGSKGPFREVYIGCESVCTVDGLHFNSVYRARVKAINRAGTSVHSDVLHLQTSEVANFHLDPKQAHPDIKLSNDNRTVTSESYENRVVLGKIGFSRGIHYWEFSIDRFEARHDPAFGVARCEVDKSQMLGKDKKGWSMYADEARNWLFHNNQHVKRTDIGVKIGSRIGVLLDIARCVVTFFIDGKVQATPLPLAPVNSTSPAVYFPAVSLNQNVQVTLHTGLPSPIFSHVTQPYRKRIQSAPETEKIEQPRRAQTPTPKLKTQLSYDGSGKQGRGPPPTLPLRRGGSSGNVSAKSDNASSAGSDSTHVRSFKSFFRKR